MITCCSFWAPLPCAASRALSTSCRLYRKGTPLHSLRKRINQDQTSSLNLESCSISLTLLNTSGGSSSPCRELATHSKVELACKRLCCLISSLLTSSSCRRCSPSKRQEVQVQVNLGLHQANRTPWHQNKKLLSAHP